jgi:lipoprotein-anchoring transpeptidase ErfK/SrfK
MTLSLDRRRLILAGAASLVSFPALAAQEIDDPYRLPAANLKAIAPEFRRTVVPYDGRQYPGTIIVDTDSRHLFLVLARQQAIRYGVGVGRDGFRWAGVADVMRKVMWPRWIPPKEMVERDDNAKKWKDGMPGGPDNPLGARAMYLFQNGVDTLYRIHGTNAPASIGKKMSSGCIRMLNEDVIDLYRRVPIGSRAVVTAQGL